MIVIRGMGGWERESEVTSRSAATPGQVQSPRGKAMMMKLI